MATSSKALTYEEWLTLPEVEGVEEVVNGEIRKMPPNKWTHARTVENLARPAQSAAWIAGQFMSWSPTFWVGHPHANRYALRVPDLAVFREDHIVEHDGYIHSAPELVVEVLSPANTRSDALKNCRITKASGVPEVWVVSPEAQTVEVLLLTRRTPGDDARFCGKASSSPLDFPEAAVDIVRHLAQIKKRRVR